MGEGNEEYSQAFKKDNLIYLLIIFEKKKNFLFFSLFFSLSMLIVYIYICIYLQYNFLILGL